MKIQGLILVFIGIISGCCARPNVFVRFACQYFEGMFNGDCPDIDDCADYPCGDYGHCTNKVNGYECRCSPGFTGTNCEIDVDDCVNNPCGDKGKCVDVINGFYCKCNPGFTGKLCNEDINDCTPNLCENSGICQDDVNSFNCLCDGTGFTGKLCESNIDDCASNPCGENGWCVVDVSGFNCTCKKGFNGANCEKENTIRLVGGDFWGRLEVYVNDCWGTVCENDFELNDAVVACKTLQLPFFRALYVDDAELGEGIGAIWWNDVGCLGNETDIRDCPRTLDVDNCDHDEDIGIICLGNITDDNVTVRLVDGPSPLEGRLEVFYNEEWGMVCDDLFKEDTAKVVCRMLGVINVTDATYSNDYGPDTGLIWLDNVNCTGSESSILDCQFNPWGETNCGHKEDVSVKCL